MRFTLQEIAHATGGRVARTGPDKSVGPTRVEPEGSGQGCGLGAQAGQGQYITGVSTDSRTVQPGDLFVALRTERRNGHAFIADAAQRGAAAALVSVEPTEPLGDLGMVAVADTLTALGRLGAMHRAQMAAQVLAVTGSVGKTTTKGMLAAILERVGPTVAAPASYNNEIGVPLTLLQLDERTRFCVLELASRNLGDISYLARMSQPQVGLITGIGISHLGRLGSREAIARAKGELLEALPADGIAVLPQADEFRPLLTELAPGTVTTFGLTDDAQVWAQVLDEGGPHGQGPLWWGPQVLLHAAGRVHEARLRVPGRHNALNAAAAAAAALAAGAQLQTVAEGLGAFTGVEMRSRIVTGLQGTTVINDAYNAAPASVKAALELLGMAPGRKLFVFGDMLELGPDAPHEHRAVGEAAASIGVARLYALGESAAETVATAAKWGVAASHFTTAEELLAALLGELQEGDTVLVKGSRAMHLERVVAGLVRHG